MWGGDDEHVGFRNRSVEREERLVINKWIGAENTSAFERRELAQLVAQRSAGVVGLALERHPQDAQRAAGKRPARVERVADVVGQALVDLHRGLPHREGVSR